MYDITKQPSYDNTERWLKELRDHADPTIVIMLVGNKSDMPEGKRAVTFAQGKALAEEFGISFFETSAKTGDAVEDVFASIARDVKGRLDKEAQGGKGGAPDTTTIRPSKQKAKGKGGCC